MFITAEGQALAGELQEVQNVIVRSKIAVHSTLQTATLCQSGFIGVIGGP